MKIVVNEYDDWIKIDIDGERYIDDHNVGVYDLLEMLSQIYGFDLEYIKHEGYDE